MSEDKKFKMRFDPNTIRHLGIKMYSQIPGALAELIANAYDADATEVKVRLYDKGGRGRMRIVVEDNGMGMTATEINRKFLVIGRDRREKEGENYKTPKGRIPSGKKGLGKLALFGIGNKIRIDTQSANKKAIAFTMDWEVIKSRRNREYNPKVEKPGKIKDGCGTVVVISELGRKSSFNQKELANSIARLFHYEAEVMSISISVNDKKPTTVTQDMFLRGLTIEVDKDVFPPFDDEGKKQPITGRIVTNKIPISPGARGVALYANGRMVNSPEFFTRSVSSHFYSYVTGYFVVDFVDEGHGDDDLISTNRQSLNWEHPRMEALRKHLRKIVQNLEKEWREARKKESDKVATKRLGSAFWNSLRRDIKKHIRLYMENAPEADKLLFVELISKIKPKRSGKKIMISHTSSDKKLANLLYRGLLARGVKPQHILYTSSKNKVSRLPPQKDIYKYIRGFFVQDWFYNPHVIYVVSPKMEKSWNAVLEVGAAWVSQTKHTLAVVNAHQPKLPLNRENYPYIVFKKNNKQRGRYQNKDAADDILDAVVSEYKKNQKAD